MPMSRYRDITLTLVRWALGALFIFSGAVKCVDPVGTSIFVDKYLATYSMEWLMPISESLAVGLSVFEFTLGALLISGVWRRFTALTAVVVLLLFSVITLLNATVLPIGDCGCFGDAVKLSPWATFLKNIIMLPFAITLWRTSDRCRVVALRDVVVLVVALSIPMSVNLHALAHLPLVDFLPYKVGVNLREAVANEQNFMRSILRFRDITTGEIKEFDAMESSCWLDNNLEFVESSLVAKGDAELKYGDFHMYSDSGEEATTELLMHNGRVALLCVNDTTKLSSRTYRGIETLYDIYPESSIYIISSKDISLLNLPYNSTKLYVDAMTLRSIIRADIGVVILNNGVVEFKANIQDL